MKQTLLIITALMLVVGYGSSDKAEEIKNDRGVSNPYILAEGVFNAFRDNDEKDFIQLFESENEKYSKEKLLISFSYLRKNAESEGINWSEAEFMEARINTSPVSFTVLRKDGYGNIFGMENGETKDIEILFKSGDSLYWIKLDNCLYENSKWFSGSPNAWGLDDDD